MDVTQKLYFRDALRNARGLTLDDAEGFEAIQLALVDLPRFSGQFLVWSGGAC